MKDDRLYLTQISKCIKRIEEYTIQGRDCFVENRLTQDAVLWNFEIIGEAVKQLSEKTLERTPDIPCRKIAHFGDVLIHGNMDVDIEQVWDVIEQHLPNFKEAVNNLL